MAMRFTSIECVDAWAEFRWLHAGFSTRHRDASLAEDNELNLGWTAEVDPAVIAANRSQFVAAVAPGQSMELYTVQQVHGGVVRDLDREDPPLMSPAGQALLPGDGLYTRTGGRMLGVVTADCVPVLVVDPQRRAVAAFHAGWRGTVAEIVTQGIHALKDNCGSRSDDLLATIGPCIRACCFEVGEEVRTQFVGSVGDVDDLVRSSAPGKDGQRRFLIDLQNANRRQLLRAGLRAERISLIPECTACTRLADGRRKYFSYRAEGGVTGRMLSVIGMAGEAAHASSATVVA